MMCVPCISVQLTSTEVNRISKNWGLNADKLYDLTVICKNHLRKMEVLLVVPVASHYMVVYGINTSTSHERKLKL